MHPDTAEFNETNFIEDIPQDLKLVINNLIWIYAPDDMSLKDAEKLAVSICKRIVEGVYFTS